MKVNLTHVVGALSLGALTLAGCSSNEAAPDQTEETTASGAEATCSGKEGEKDGESSENKCGAGQCGGGKCGGGK